MHFVTQRYENITFNTDHQLVKVAVKESI